MATMSVGTKVALLVVFGLVAAVFVGSAGLARRRWVLRVNDVAHAVMATEMVAMTWWPPVEDPLRFQVAVFAVACAWFLVQATGLTLTSTSFRAHFGSPPAPGTSRDAGVRRWEHLHHAVLMAAMVWMVSAPASHPGHAALHSGANPPPTGVVLAAGVYCMVSAPMWGWSVARGRRQRGRAVAHALMGVGMGVMLIAMY